MRIFIVVLLIFSLAGCNASKSVANKTSSKDSKLVLPPDTPSNKYSKTRQANRN